MAYAMGRKGKKSELRPVFKKKVEQVKAVGRKVVSAIKKKQ